MCLLVYLPVCLFDFPWKSFGLIILREKIDVLYTIVERLTNARNKCEARKMFDFVIAKK